MKAVTYSRVSTDEQNTDRQVKELDEYAKYKGFQVVAEFRENISGRTKQTDRLEFSRMLKYIRENNIKHIMVHELSRIGRNNRNTINIIEDLIAEGICIHSKHENIMTLNPDGTKNNQATLFISIFSAIAESEVETLRARVKSGLRASKLRGGANAAVQPFGFQSIGKKLSIHPDEVKTVKVIYDLYLDGYSMNRIAQHLNDLGIPSKKATKWRDKTINDILKNPLYKGERFHNGERIPYDLERIIPIEKWNAVQSLIKKKAEYQNRHSKNLNILRGLLFCGNCGEPLFMQRRKNLKDNVYKCLSSKSGYDGKSCSLKGINIDLLNNIVVALAMTSELFDFEVTKNKVVKANEDLDRKIDNMRNQITELEKGLARLTTAFMKGSIKESMYDELASKTNSDISKLHERKQKYEQQLQIIPEKPKKSDINMSGEGYMKEIRKIIARIEVTNLPLEGTPFNQRKDNIAYKIHFTLIGGIPTEIEYPGERVVHTSPGEEFTVFTSSRDKRLFSKISEDDVIAVKNPREVWKFSGLDFTNAPVIQI